jgi:hypothetical protein
LLGHRIDDGKFAPVMLLVPSAELADVQQQTQLIPDTGIARFKTKQSFRFGGQSVVGEGNLILEYLRLVHVPKSFRRMPQPLLT